MAPSPRLRLPIGGFLAGGSTWLAEERALTCPGVAESVNREPGNFWLHAILIQVTDAKLRTTR